MGFHPLLKAGRKLSTLYLFPPSILLGALLLLRSFANRLTCPPFDTHIFEFLDNTQDIFLLHILYC
ncbi:hypothetical protein D3C80_1916400 [compost metagenome]